jgi:hypothetical protein
VPDLPELDDNIYLNIPVGTNYVVKSFSGEVVVFNKIYTVNLD